MSTGPSSQRASRWGRGWPNWRHGNADQRQVTLTSPATGVLFDAEHNAFWDPRWGERPTDARARARLAQDKLTRVR